MPLRRERRALVVLEMRVDRGANLAMEVERGRGFRAIQIRDIALVDVREVTVPTVVAGVRGEQLVDRRERACDLRQIKELDLQAVGERVERIQRAPVRGTERDKRPRVPPSVEALEEVARDQPAHRVADEDELRIVRAAGGA